MTTVAGNRGGAGFVEEEDMGIVETVRDWFTIAPTYRTKEKLIAMVSRENLLLTQENARLWERIKELQKPITFDFYAGGFQFRGTVIGPEHIEIVRIGPK